MDVFGSSYSILKAHKYLNFWTVWNNLAIGPVSTMD